LKIAPYHHHYYHQFIHQATKQYTVTQKLRHAGKAVGIWQPEPNNTFMNNYRITHTYARNQGQWSVGSNDRMQRNGKSLRRTDCHDQIEANRITSPLHYITVGKYFEHKTAYSSDRASDLFLGGSVLLLGSDQLGFDPVRLGGSQLTVVVPLSVAVGLHRAQHAVGQHNVPRVQHATDVLERRLLAGSETVVSVETRVGAVLQKHLHCTVHAAAQQRH